MLDKRTKISITLFFLLGAAIQITTSLTWLLLSTEKLGYGDATVGESYFMAGQAVGEFIWLLTIRLWVVKGLLFGELVIEYLICLIIFDLISIFFLHPFQVEVSKNGAFVFATLGYLYRLKYI
jgi:hypothetical protein